MATEIIALLNTFKDPILKNLKDIKEKAIYFFDNGLFNYLNVQKEKHEYTKTFLFRDKQVKFYETFFPVSLGRSQDHSGFKTGKVNTGENCFSVFDNLNYQKNYIMIIGYAGSGKSMLMKHFFLECIDKLYRIPIFIELRIFNSFRGSVLEYITSVLFTNKVVPYENMGILKRILNEGKVLFLLDGFDELYSEHKIKILEDLNNFIDTYGKNLFIITSRPGTNIESFARFHNFYVQGLESHEVPLFITQQLQTVDNIHLANQVITTIQKPENIEYKTYLENPLLLSMFILTYNSHPELPRSKSKFYFNVFDTLITKHDSIKMPGYQHQRVSNLLNEQIEIILKWFSYISFFEGNYSFSSKYIQGKLSRLSEKLKMTFNIDDLIYDLSISIAILLKDGVEYRFPHRTLQEFFAALLISELKTEIKYKIYKEKFKKLEQKSYSGNDNFLKMCVELDKNSFYKNWAIPNLLDHIKQIEVLDEDEQVDIQASLINYLNFSEVKGILGIDKNTGAINEMRFLWEKEFTTANKVLSILNRDVNLIKTLVNLLNEPQVLASTHEFFFNLLKDKILDRDYTKSTPLQDIYYFPIDKLWNSNFYSIIEKGSLPTQLSAYVATIKEIVHLLKVEIEENEKIQIDLLDFD